MLFVSLALLGCEPPQAGNAATKDEAAPSSPKQAADTDRERFTGSGVVDLSGLLHKTPDEVEALLGKPTDTGKQRISCVRFVPERVFFACEQEARFYAHPKLERIGMFDDSLEEQARSIFSGTRTAAPMFRSSFCGAHSTMYVIDAFADIYACWERTGDPKLRIGYIEESGAVMMDRFVLERWRGRGEQPRAQETGALFASFGLRKEDLIGRQVGLSTADPAHTQSLCRSALTGAVHSFVISRGGRSFAVTIAPVRSAGPHITHGLLFAFDQTSRMRAEQEIASFSLE